jgi:hypothetical protein
MIVLPRTAEPGLQRFTGRRELLPETINAIAGVVSGRTITW